MTKFSHKSQNTSKVMIHCKFSLGRGVIAAMRLVVLVTSYTYDSLVSLGGGGDFAPLLYQCAFAWLCVCDRILVNILSEVSNHLHTVILRSILTVVLLYLQALVC